jgi:hypothetical protein
MKMLHDLDGIMRLFRSRGSASQEKNYPQWWQKKRSEKTYNTTMHNGGGGRLTMLMLAEEV